MEGQAKGEKKTGSEAIKKNIFIGNGFEGNGEENKQKMKNCESQGRRR